MPLNNNNNNENDSITNTVITAMNGLECGIEKLYNKYERRCKKRLQLTILPEIEEQKIKKHKKRIQPILNHIKYSLIQLQKQINALQIGLQCFHTKLLSTIPKFTNNNNDKNTVILSLQHIFQWFIRLHDGYILIISGECRHNSDIQKAKKTKFPSHLCNNNDEQQTKKNSDESSKQQQHQSFGKLFSKDKTYNGTSWDEIMNEHVGLRIRLIKLLRYLVPDQQRESLWDDLIEEHGMGFEQIIIKIENDMTEIQTQFTKLIKYEFVSCIKQAFPSNNAIVELKWNDKMEQLHINSSLITGGKIQFERYANNFQITGNSSALPIEWITVQDWWNHMQWPTTIAQQESQQQQKKKRRKIIIESSDDEDDNDCNAEKKSKSSTGIVNNKDKGSNKAKNCNNNVNKENNIDNNNNKETKNLSSSSTGLVVKVVKATNIKTTETTSVNEIKQKLGINVNELSAAFDNLNAEEAGTIEAATIIDNTPVDSYDFDDQQRREDDLYNIQQTERKVRQKEKILQKVLLEENNIDDEIAMWNAREVLREALMLAGDAIISADSIINQNNNKSSRKNDDLGINKRKLLRKAIQFFSDAKGQVMALQQQLHASSQQTNSDLVSTAEDSRYYLRNLLLLKGRAQINIAIANIHSAIQCYHERDPIRKTHFDTAIQELDRAISSAKVMQSKSYEDAKVGCSLRETSVDRFQALQLESFALRWKAYAQWHLYQKEEAVKALTAAASVVQKDDMKKEFQNGDLADDELREALIECQIECFLSWTTLYDLSSSTLDRASVNAIRENSQYYDKILQYLITAVNNAYECSIILKTTEMDKNFRIDKGLYTPNEIKETLNDVQNWWKRKKENATRPISNNGQQQQCPGRSDLMTSSNGLYQEPIPTTRMVVTESNRRHRSKYNLGGNTSDKYNAAQRSLSDHQASTSSQVVVETTTTTTSGNNKKYRKWREDMIFDSNNTGQLIPKLVYPSIAPKMPQEFIEIQAARRGNGGTT